MDRATALDRICREGALIVSPLYAEIVAAAFDRTLTRLELDPRPARELAERFLTPGDGGAVRIAHGHREDVAIAMWELSARLALSFGLYGSIDHAMQSIHHQPAAEARYIACRGAVRLARMWGGPDAVAALRERNPWMEARLFTEQPYTGTGEVLRV